jgi:endonuclease/exonuclease/phosphatase family metal-dependent hydrolase
MKLTLGSAVALVLALSVCTRAGAQWNPPAGQWGKVDPADLRVMTWNVRDGICSSNAKVEGQNNWCAIARIIAALKPDVLILEETGDNSGNGTGSGVDSVAELTETLDDLLHGGTDGFHGNSPITSWVQKYAPSYDLPYVFVSVENDGFNRNVLLSRFPFSDLNGDTRATISDIPTVTATGYAPGGDGGIRGFLFAEIDLPSVTYRGDFVMGGSHLKSGGQASDQIQRVEAAQNVAYVIRNWFNGGGTPVPDPAARIADSPQATSVLDALTPVVIGGDWNEDEVANGTFRGPAAWLSQALVVGGTSDGTDADGSDMTLDSAVVFFTGSDASHSGGDKLDYVSWQDSICTLRLSTIFLSGSNPASAQPPELNGFPNPQAASATASDHRPVLCDLRLPIVDCNGNGVADTTDITNGTAQDQNGNQIPDDCECYSESYCITSPNSVGPGALMDSAGSFSIAANNFFLLAYGLPPGTAGLFYYGQGETQVPFGNGFRCVAGSVFRLPILNADLLGTANLQLDFPALPSAGMIHPGETWRFQIWYRNPAGGGAGYNLSDGRRVRFCP